MVSQAYVNKHTTSGNLEATNQNTH